MKAKGRVIISILCVFVLCKCSLAEDLSMESLVDKYKNESYDEKKVWMHFRMRQVVYKVSDDEQSKTSIFRRRLLSLVVGLRKPKFRIDIKEQPPGKHDYQLIMTEGKTMFLTDSGANSEDLYKIKQEASSLASLCRLLVWPKGNEFRTLHSSNMIEIVMNDKPVRLTVDNETKELLLVDFMPLKNSIEEKFTLGGWGEWRQGLRLPYMWELSDGKTKSVFSVDVLRLSENLDTGCFEPEGMKKDLRQYLQDSIFLDAKTSASRVHFTKEQKELMASGANKVAKEIQALQQKYADDPEKRKREEGLLLKQWKQRLKEIKAMK